MPNPFTPRTSLRFELAEARSVDLDIYDIRGALVQRLVRGVLPAGRHERVWDGTDHGGRQVPGGVYFVQMRAGALSQTRKVLLVR
jgi:flagellar hook assembly protein FlgD